MQLELHVADVKDKYLMKMKIMKNQHQTKDKWLLMSVRYNSCGCSFLYVCNEDVILENIAGLRTKFCLCTLNANVRTDDVPMYELMMQQCMN